MNSISFSSFNHLLSVQNSKVQNVAFKVEKDWKPNKENQIELTLSREQKKLPLEDFSLPGLNEGGAVPMIKNAH